MADDRTVYLKDYKPYPFHLDETILSFELDPKAATVHAELRFRYKNPVVGGEAQSAPLVLNGEDVKLLGLYMDGRKLSQGQDYEIAPNKKGGGELLTILRPPWSAPSFTVGIITEINPDENTTCEGLYRSSGNYSTQCEAEGFRRIIFYPDRPDVMSRYTVKIIADKKSCPVLLSNGNQVAALDMANGKHMAIWVDPFPKPCYLFALVAGDLVPLEDSFTTMSGKSVVLRIYTEAKNAHKTSWAMVSLKKAMKWDEEKFGREYDLEILNVVAVDDFNMGAMENKSLMIFNSKLILATPQTATDRDYYNIEGVIGHEYFHNWTGNRVTCRDWFQLSLKEGLTVFRDQEFTSDMNSRAVKRIDDVRLLRANQFSEDAGAMSHPVRPPAYEKMDNFYTCTVYEKGAEVIRMYHTLLSPTGFRKGTDLYFQRHDGQAVTTDDFYQAMMDANGEDGENFRLWYSQAGTPTVKADCSYDAGSKAFTIVLEQNVPVTADTTEPKEPMMIPVALGLVGPDGKDTVLTKLSTDGGPDVELPANCTTAILKLSKAKQTYKLSGIASKPVPSILRNFSAPVKLVSNISDEDRIFLLANDSDAVTRWDSVQTLATNVVLDLYKNPPSSGLDKLQLPGPFVDAFRSVLQNKSLDKKFVAQVLTLPIEAQLVDDVKDADPVAIHQCRKAVIVSLATTLKDLFMAVYKENTLDEEYVPSVEGMAKRALRIATLGYLANLNTPETRSLCMEAFKSATNMTEQMGALACVAMNAGAEREEALESFYQQWKEDPLVLNGWLRLQATSEIPGNTERVKKLLEHAAFDIKNPNKCYSTIRSFPLSCVNFHNVDGSGYKFLADCVLKLDGMNPQVAAACAGDFTNWSYYDLPRRKLMIAELRRMAGTEGLSPNVGEIVTKSLKAAEGDEASK